MADFPWGQLITAMGTLGGAAIGGLMGHWLSRDKHKRERLWELRVAVLSDILHALSAGALGLEEAMELYEKSAARPRLGESFAKLQSEAYADLHRASDKFRSNALIFSPAFSESFSRYSQRMEAVEIDDDELGAMREHALIVRSEMILLREIARRDIA